MSLAGEGGVKVGHVEHVLGQLGLHGRLNRLLENFLFVKGVKPRVAQYFLEAALGAQSLCGVLLEHLKDG